MRRPSPIPLAALSFALVTASASARAQGLYPGKQFPVGSHPRAVATGDLNLDGMLDAVSTNYGTNDLSVLLAVTPGELTPGVTFGAGGGPESLVLRDFDGDGKLDVAYANSLANDVTTRSGDGLGSFGPGAQHAMDTGVFQVPPRALTAGDVTGDGFVDLVAGGYTSQGTSNRIVVFMGSSGGFSAGNVLGTPNFVSDLEVGDLDGDGAVDIVAASLFSDTITFVRSLGLGVFATPLDSPVPTRPSSVELPDLDGDGILDVVIGHFANPPYQTTVMRGTGGGLLAAPAAVPSNGQTRTIVAADFNHDGIPDLAAVKSLVATVEVRAGDGVGGFGASILVPTGHLPWGLTAADMNADGGTDLIATNAGHEPLFGGLDPGTVSVLLGNGLASFGAGPSVPVGPPVGVSPGSSPRATGVIDLNADGLPDLVTACSGTHDVSVRLGAGGGTFGAETRFPAGPEPRGLALADLNSDGRCDAAIPNATAGGVGVLLGNGAGALGAPTFVPTAAGPNRVAAGDADGDGKLDLIVTHTFPVETATVSAGDGNGGFGAPQPVHVGPQPQALALADLDENGLLDLVVGSNASTGAAGLTVSLGTGGGGFAVIASYLVGGGARAVAVGDLDSDGHADVAASTVPMVVALLKGNGLGVLSVAGTVPLARVAEAVAIGDVDRDGKPDLVTAHSNEASVGVTRANGTFELYAAEIAPFGVAIADLDGDGGEDLAVPSFSSRGVTVLRNTAPAPAALAPFGPGTPGCVGVSGMLANGAPAVGNSGFRLTATNVPQGALGLAVVGTALDPTGSDALGLGVRFHVDLSASTALFFADLRSDAAGAAWAPLPIPAVPSLAGVFVVAQGIWLWPATAPCDPSPLGLSSTRGLGIVIHP